MSRRSQFENQRTNWHDLQGRHCPRFEQETFVAIPIPKPKDYHELDEYKIQFAFDHERLVSSWLTIISKPNAPGAAFDLFHGHKLTNEVLVPFVTVTLWKRDDELLRVKVESRRLPEQYMSSHPELVKEYKDHSHWPKHILVKYQWESYDEVDAERGLLVLLYGGLFMIVVMILGVLVNARENLERFLTEIATGVVRPTGPSIKAEDKGE
eukprot:g4398.t1